MALEAVSLISSPICGSKWPGSGGSGNYSSSYPSRGGGVIRVFASGDALINGFLRADGANAGSYAGAGAGGTVLLQCRTLNGADGVVSVDGGTAVSPDSPGLRGGGGGGGRIAVWRRAGDAEAVCTVDGGVGGLNEDQPDYEAYCGEGGTVVWGWLPQTGTTLLLR